MDKLNPIMRTGAWLTDLSAEDLTNLLAGLYYIETYQYVDVVDLKQKIIEARARLRQERDK